MPEKHVLPSRNLHEFQCVACNTIITVVTEKPKKLDKLVCPVCKMSCILNFCASGCLHVSQE